MAGALLVTGDGQVRALAHEFDVEGLAAFYRHKITIENYEAMALRLAQETWRELLADCVCFTKVDNCGELYAAVKCSAKSLLTCNICTRIAMAAHARNTRTWYEYVKSELNCADPFSRWDKLRIAQQIWKPEMDEPAAMDWAKEFRGPMFGGMPGEEKWI